MEGIAAGVDGDSCKKLVSKTSNKQPVTPEGRSCHTVGLQDLFLELILTQSLFQFPWPASASCFVSVPAEDDSADVDGGSSKRVGDTGSV